MEELLVNNAVAIEASKGCQLCMGAPSSHGATPARCLIRSWHKMVYDYSGHDPCGNTSDSKFNPSAPFGPDRLSLAWAVSARVSEMVWAPTALSCFVWHAQHPTEASQRLTSVSDRSPIWVSPIHKD